MGEIVHMSNEKVISYFLTNEPSITAFSPETIVGTAADSSAAVKIFIFRSYWVFNKVAPTRCDDNACVLTNKRSTTVPLWHNEIRSWEQTSRTYCRPIIGPTHSNRYSYVSLSVQGSVPFEKLRIIALPHRDCGKHDVLNVLRKLWSQQPHTAYRQNT